MHAVGECSFCLECHTDRESAVAWIAALQRLAGPSRQAGGAFTFCSALADLMPWHAGGASAPTGTGSGTLTGCASAAAAPPAAAVAALQQQRTTGTCAPQIGMSGSTVAVTRSPWTGSAGSGTPAGAAAARNEVAAAMAAGRGALPACHPRLRLWQSPWTRMTWTSWLPWPALTSQVGHAGWHQLCNRHLLLC